MITVEKQIEGAKFLNTLFEKAWEDPSFKTQLVEHPFAAIEAFTGEPFALPESKKLVFEDQSDESVIYLNIPAQPSFDELELTDEQLEQVAGGEVGVAIGVVAGVIGICYFARDVYNGWNTVN